MSILGVALEIPEPYAEELRVARESFGDPEARTVPPHVTIVAPVSIDPGQWGEVERHLEDSVSGVAPFRMHLRGTGTFRPVTRVVFVAVAEGIPGCEEIERRVRRGPLALERTFPFHPHVTVALDLDDAALDEAFSALADYEAVFPVERLSLYELEAHHWRVRREFRLGEAER